MRPGRLTWRALRHYRISHAGVMLAAALTSSVLIGGLLLGSSMKESLARIARRNLGNIQQTAQTGQRLVNADLAGEGEGSAALLLLSGQATNAAEGPQSSPAGRAAQAAVAAASNRVQVVGVDERFWKLYPARPREIPDGAVIFNTPLAEQLRVRAGDDVLLKVPVPSALPKDLMLALEERGQLSFRLKVAEVIGADDFGYFNRSLTQRPPHNAFVSRAWLSRQLGTPGKANFFAWSSDVRCAMFDVRCNDNRTPAEPSNIEHPTSNISLEDLGLTLTAAPGRADSTGQKSYQLSTDAVFFSPATEDVLSALPLPGDPPRQPILTYFVNEIRHGLKSTPYSFITGSVPPAQPSQANGPAIENPLPMPPADDQIVLTDWLADDLDAKVGDAVEITYFVLGPSRKLQERSSRFTVASIVPLTQHADSALMPSFPGISDAVSCRDWKSGLPIDTGRIRPTDEQYWNEHRGTPKAYVTLAQAEQLWSTVYGSTTAIRYYPQIDAGGSPEQFGAEFLARLSSADFGFLFTSYSSAATAGRSKAAEFSGLFLGLSMFLIISALLLAGLVVSFSLRSRAAQVGLLQALGWSTSRIGRAIMQEFSVPILAGSLLGLAGGTGYGLLLVWGLKTIWRGAVHTSEIVFAIEPLWLFVGPAATCVLCCAVCWLVVATLLRRTPHSLLAGQEKMPRPQRTKWPMAVIAALTLALLVGSQFLGQAKDSPLVWFAFSVTVLAMLLLLELLRLRGSFRPRRERARSLVPMHASRRPGRSFAVVAMMACGCFLTFTVAGNRRIELSPEKFTEGSGGFNSMVTLAVPLLLDPTTPQGRATLHDPDGAGSILPLRVLSGDDASCLNLGQVLRPQVLGVRPGLLAKTRFVLKQSLDPSAGWDILSRRIGGAVPAIVDETTLLWGLQGKLGMDLIYVDEAGQRFTVRIAAVMADGILQGSVLIDEAEFIRRFPSQAGYRMLLLKEEPSRWTAALDRYGPETIESRHRLAELHEVENTYLSIFALLGGLALVLGSAGVGIVLLRNVLERQGELALLQAVGFTRRKLTAMVVREHFLLLEMGLVDGVLAAMVALGPARVASREFPWSTVGLAGGGILLVGIVCVYRAARWAIHRPVLPALRNE